MTQRVGLSETAADIDCHCSSWRMLNRRRRLSEIESTDGCRVYVNRGTVMDSLPKAKYRLTATAMALRCVLLLLMPAAAAAAALVMPMMALVMNAMHLK